MKHMKTGALCLAASVVMLASNAQAYSLLGTKWGVGPNVAQVNTGNIPSPGSATWSIMGAGLGFNPANETHGGNLTSSLGALVGGASTAEEVAMINAAFATWSAVCAFTSLGQVADGGVAGGANGAGGELGDIRFCAVHIDGAFGVLAHAYQPGCNASFGLNWNIGGDTHFDEDETWVDEANDAAADADFDFQTVALHEIGHALGLGHSSVVGSVMEPIYAGGRRTLHADDIAGIRALYGVVPEPGTIAVLGLGALALMRRRR